MHTFWQDDETATVTDSVDFTEANAEAMSTIDKEAPVNDKEAPETDKEASCMEQEASLSDKDASNDPLVVMDKEASAVEEISTGGNFALFMAQV